MRTAPSGPTPAQPGARSARSSIWRSRRAAVVAREGRGQSALTASTRLPVQGPVGSGSPDSPGPRRAGQEPGGAGAFAGTLRVRRSPAGGRLRYLTTPALPAPPWARPPGALSLSNFRRLPEVGDLR